jgi:hypothetical protein
MGPDRWTPRDVRGRRAHVRVFLQSRAHPRRIADANLVIPRKERHDCSPLPNRATIDAIRQAEGEALYTETDGGHGIWQHLYDDPTGELYDGCLMASRRRWRRGRMT